MIERRVLVAWFLTCVTCLALGIAIGAVTERAHQPQYMNCSHVRLVEMKEVPDGE